MTGLGAPLSSSVLKRRYISLQNEWMNSIGILSSTTQAQVSRGFLLPKSMMHVSYYLPYFQKIYKFPYFAKFLNFLPTFIKFTIYGVIHIFCASP